MKKLIAAAAVAVTALTGTIVSEVAEIAPVAQEAEASHPYCTKAIQGQYAVLQAFNRAVCRAVVDCKGTTPTHYELVYYGMPEVKRCPSGVNWVTIYVSFTKFTDNIDTDFLDALERHDERFVPAPEAVSGCYTLINRQNALDYATHYSCDGTGYLESFLICKKSSLSSSMVSVHKVWYFYRVSNKAVSHYCPWTYPYLARADKIQY